MPCAPCVCSGRTDATEGSGWSALSPNTNYSATIYDVQLAGALQGLTPTETVVLSARLRSPSLIQVCPAAIPAVMRPSVYSIDFAAFIFGAVSSAFLC